MAFDGNTLVAVYSGENLFIGRTTSLSAFLASDCVDVMKFSRQILTAVAYFHRAGLVVGPNSLLPDCVLVVESSEGPKPVLVVSRSAPGGSVQEDIRAAGDLFRHLWVAASRVPDALEQNLISGMIGAGEPPCADDILRHLAFWPSEKKLGFLMEVSDVLELKQAPHLAVVEQGREEVFGESWIEQLAPVLQEKVERGIRKTRHYSGSLVRDLLRAVRNLGHHYHTIGPGERAALGPRDRLGDFWTSAFPSLLPLTHAAMEPFKDSTCCASIRPFYTAA
jgi:hypothetical protein